MILDSEALARDTAALRSIKERIAELIEIEKQLTGRLKDHMVAANSDVIIIDGRAAVTWKTVTATRVDTKKLRAEFPSIAEICHTTTTSRRFLITPVEGE